MPMLTCRIAAPPTCTAGRETQPIGPMTDTPDSPTQNDAQANAYRIARIRQSSSYRQAHTDPDFMGRTELRPVRLQLELLKPELIQEEQGVRSTVVAFGGTRVVERPEAE